MADVRRTQPDIRDDVSEWEDELIFAELEAGLCPWIFRDVHDDE